MPKAAKGNGFGARIVSPNGKSNTLCVSPASSERNLIVASHGRACEDGITRQNLEPRTDGKSNCLTTVQKENLVIEDGSALRRLTPVECARLQTVPDWYEWIVSDTQIYRMCGNGWTVRVIEHILKNLFV